MPTVYIGLGSNLRHPAKQIQDAFFELEQLPYTRLRACSGLYKTRAVGPGRQPHYINAVACLETSLPPLPLLDFILGIENNHHRARSRRRWRPRTLDLDVLLYGSRSINHPRLSIPHPLLHTRAFVLAPLSELAPDLIIPRRGRVRSLLNRVQQEGVAVLDA